MDHQSLFGFLFVLLLVHQLRTASCEPQFSDSNGFVKLPSQLQQKVYKYSQDYQGNCWLIINVWTTNVGKNAFAAVKSWRWLSLLFVFLWYKVLTMHGLKNGSKSQLTRKTNYKIAYYGQKWTWMKILVSTCCKLSGTE